MFRDDQRAGTISIDSTSVRRGGEPWFPVMGEYHFSRDRPERWQHELQKIRAGGIDVVATYVIWILHEEARGERRFDGHLDLRRFVEEAHRAGLSVMLRIGPWAHGEARNGGFPDWLQELPVRHRTNDPAYLEVVEGWYRDIATQLSGLFRDAEHPEAPIVGIQVDNELYDQPEHLARLRELAEQVGMSAPLWVATGWGGAQVPLDRLAPVYAGYSDAFWEEADIEWPPFARMHFEYSTVRDDLSVGADVRGATSAVEPVAEDHRYPFLTCELGGGMTTAYHRRPLVDGEDIAALGLTKIGSGSAWQGFYLYHGTTQVTGADGGGLQESHDSGYPNDMPRKDYDFFAPIGAAGTLRPHYHLLRRQHLFLERWGGALTALPVTLPDAGSGVRWALRADERRGYVFVTNRQPAAQPLPRVDGVRFSVATGDTVTTLPSEPVSVPSGAFFVWPVRQRFGSIEAVSATAQPITELSDGTATVVFLASSPGIPVELEFETTETVRGATLVDTPAGPRWLPDRAPGRDCVVTVGDTRLVILDDATASLLWRVDVGGESVALLVDGGVVVDGEGIVLERWTGASEVAVLRSSALGSDSDDLFEHLRLAEHEPIRELPVAVVRADSSAAPVRRGGSMDRLSAPEDGDFDDAAVVEIRIAELDPDAATVLVLEWSGDVARLEIGGVLVADQFWSGRSWEIDLAPWREALASSPVRVRILPWREDSGVFVDARVRGRRRPGLAGVDSARLLTAVRHHLDLGSLAGWSA
ncbi:Glycosyl hydrolases family 35 [Rathayibacter oskolensis]|uniref:Glycosyl hydrolases family 35 n=1 Tax=Rathayibacter oskolensis TaxID=1891671 RepID=A0A1X7PJ60_9MICO|nr:beta-galactosidase [Rathayibacter oskolensis]SMH50912.1 Glycosyl hydrolases family 35 [Rathayibacter oskolensis]